MSRRTPLAAFLLVALVGCGGAAGDTTTTTAGVTYSVSGYAHAGPTCPVMQYPPDPACADRPVAGAVILVLDGSGARVAETATAADGTFTLMLVPGEYSVVAQPVEGLMGTPPAQDLIVGGAVVALDLAYDTGIR